MSPVLWGIVRLPAVRRGILGVGNSPCQPLRMPASSWEGIAEPGDRLTVVGWKGSKVQFNFIYFRSIVDGKTGGDEGFPVWGIVEVGKSVYWRHAGRGV